MYDSFIDSIAAFKKFEIESSGATRDKKEWEKSKVECISSVLKLMQIHPRQSMTVMGLDLEQIRTIKKIAEQYSAEKVVLFPYPNGQNIVSLIRVYGGDRKQFFQHLGWTSIDTNSPLEFETKCDGLIKEYGVVLYEST